MKKNVLIISIAIFLFSCNQSQQNRVGLTNTKDTVLPSIDTGNQPPPVNTASDTVAAQTEPNTNSNPVTCEKTELATIENFKVWKLNASGAIVFKAKMAIDADGSPNAYCPDNKGLDFTANAGKPGNWYGVVTDQAGKPVIQKAGDPSPGCYVSPTTLVDKTLANTNPLKYCNSETIPFIALPGLVQQLGKIKLGDMVYVYNTKNKKSSYAIFADGGPKGKLGEGSVLLADKLGINKSPRNGGASGGIVYIVFPGTGKGQGYLRTAAEIDQIAAEFFIKAGGTKLIACLSF